MAGTQKHRKNASDGGSIVDTPQANTPVDEQPTADAGRRGRDPREEQGDLTDAADPSKPAEQRRSRIGSAGGGDYPGDGKGNDSAG
jgi:hypothetical protein